MVEGFTPAGTVVSDPTEAGVILCSLMRLGQALLLYWLKLRIWYSKDYYHPREHSKRGACGQPPRI
jgi:hypothetical protein